MTPALLARVTDSVPVIVIRKRCCYCAIPHPMDLLGPILPGQLVSDGLCTTAFDLMSAELDALEVAR